MSAQDHGPECAEIVFAQHALDRLKYESDFVAAPANFLFSQFFGFFGFADSWHWQFAAINALYVSAILLWPHQFVLTAAHEFQQIFKKLSNAGGANVIIQLQFADVSAQENPQLRII